MDDRTLALLGDRAAQERITERGELLPCPLCGVNLIVHPPSRIYFHERNGCLLDRVGIPIESAAQWNTRAPILSAEEMEMLEGME